MSAPVSFAFAVVAGADVARALNSSGSGGRLTSMDMVPSRYWPCEQSDKI